MYMKTQVLRCGMYTCMNILTHAHTHDCIGGVCWLVCFFLLWPLFCSCPASLVSRKFFAVGPGCAKCFFFVALCWAPRPFGGARAKKKHHPGCFFFLLRPRGKAREGEAPLEAGTGPEQKKKRLFALAPCRRPTGLLLPLPFAGAAAKKKNTLGGVFVLLWPRAGFQRGFSFPCLSPGPQQKKKHPGWCFFFALAPCRLPTGLLLPLPFAGAAAKKKSPWVVFFFFAAAPRGRSLTHCGPGWRCLPLAGAVFFFLLRPRPDRGGVLFLCCGPARTLTHSRWAGAISARPGWCFFFAAAPPGLFRQ